MSEVWPLARLSDHVDIAIGGTPSRVEPSFWAEKPNGHPWLAISDLRSKYILETREHISDLGVKSSNVKYIPAGSTVMSFKLSVGRTAITTVDMYSNEAIAAFFPRTADVIDTAWLYHVLPRIAGSVVTDAAVKGATLNKAKMTEMIVRLPGYDEQRAIRRVLDTVDATIRQTEAIIAKLKEVKHGLLHDLLTRGIDANGELRPSQSEAAHLYKHSQLGWIPKEWNIDALGQMADIASGVTLGRNVTGFGAIELPYLRVANVQDGFLDLSEIKFVPIFRSELERYRLEVDDVLMNEGGDFDKLGRGAVWDGQIENCLHQNHVFRVRCDQRILKARYLAALSASVLGKTYFVRASKQTTNLASINSTQLKAFPVCLPSPDEQSVIVERITESDARIEQEQGQLTKLYRMKSGLMDDLLTGRVRVTPLLALATTSTDL